MTFIVSLALTLFLPVVTITIWRRRPVASFILAAIILILSTVLPGPIKVFQAMMIYGEGDPELMAGAISEVLVSAVLSLIITLPLLFVIQRLIIRYFKKKDTLENVEDTFS